MDGMYECCRIALYERWGVLVSVRVYVFMSEGAEIRSVAIRD